MKTIHTALAIALAFSSTMLHSTNVYADNTANPLSIISNNYADADLKLSLALTPNSKACEQHDCANNALFDEKIKTIGEQLKLAMYEAFPDEKAYPDFEFEVAEKADIGTVSNANGKIVVYRNLQTLELSDAALSFIIAREMGHVFAKHNSKNASTKLWITAIVSVAFPAVALIHASSTAAQISTASSAISSVGSTLTSAVGNKLAMQSVKPTQLAEADEVAYKICNYQQLDMVAIAYEIKLAADNNTNTWVKDLQKTQLSLEKRLSSAVALAH